MRTEGGTPFERARVDITWDIWLEHREEFIATVGQEGAQRVVAAASVSFWEWFRRGDFSTAEVTEDLAEVIHTAFMEQADMAIRVWRMAERVMQLDPDGEQEA